MNGKLQTRYEQFCGKNPRFAYHLRTWGEAGTVTLKNEWNAKPDDRGVTCMFVEYATDHEGDCYIMYNVAKKSAYRTRDIIWLKRMYFDKLLPLNQTAVEPVVDNPRPEEYELLPIINTAAETGESGVPDQQMTGIIGTQLKS